MNFTETERANLRAYLGFSKLFTDFNSRLEVAMNVIEQLDDDDATITRIRSVLDTLSSLDDKLEELHCTAFVEMAGSDKVKINSIRAIQMLKMEGRRYIQQLAIALGCQPMKDYYSPAPLNESWDGMSNLPPYSY